MSILLALAVLSAPPIIVWTGGEPTALEADDVVAGHLSSAVPDESGSDAAGDVGKSSTSTEAGPWCAGGTAHRPAEVTYHPEVGIPHEVEARLVEVADGDCVNRYGTRQTRPGDLDPWAALTLLRLEQAAGVPVDELGLTLAAWCREASFKRDPQAGDGGLAVGPMQLHPAFQRLCDIDRSDLEESARCYLSRVAHKLDKVQRRCGVRSWSIGEAWTASWPRYGDSCVLSQHGEIQRRWRERL